MTSYWLIKTEPKVYSWIDLLQEEIGCWDGVRNYQARNNLQKMRMGDPLFFYHSTPEKTIVGVAEVVKEAYSDPTTSDDRWVAVDISPQKKLPIPVTLGQLKSNEHLENMALLKQSRLSVSPVTFQEYKIISKLGGL